MLEDLTNKGINKILFYVADPFDSHEELNEDELNLIRSALNEKFEFGYSLLNTLREDSISCCYDPEQFKEIKVPTRYGLLENIMEKRPKELVDKIKRYYRSYVDLREGRERKPDRSLSEEEKKIIELSGHTHKWHQQVEKHYNGPTDFNYLKKMKLGNNSLYVIRNENKNYPNYPIHSIFRRQKTGERITSKLIRNILRQKADITFDEEYCTINDIFGLRIIGLNWSTKDKIDKFVLYQSYLPERNRLWEVRETKDYRKDVSNRLDIFRYYVSLPGYPETISLQYTTLVGFLLGEFFNVNSHNLYEHEQKQMIKKYEKRSDYKVMKHRLDKLLNFLP